mgnify:CR=1 FL=1
MDNLGSHRGKIIRQLIRSVGAKLFLLPKYSPDLNPIEQVFAKLKHLLRKAAARTLETVGAAIGELLGAFSCPRELGLGREPEHRRARARCADADEAALRQRQDLRVAVVLARDLE